MLSRAAISVDRVEFNPVDNTLTVYERKDRSSYGMHGKNYQRSKLRVPLIIFFLNHLSCKSKGGLKWTKTTSG